MVPHKKIDIQYDTLPSPCLQDQTACLPGTILKKPTSPWPTLRLTFYLWSVPWNKSFKSRFYTVIILDSRIQLSKAGLPAPDFETPHSQHVSNALLLANRLSTDPTKQAMSAGSSEERPTLKSPCFCVLILSGDILGQKASNSNPSESATYSSRIFSKPPERSDPSRTKNLSNTV